MQGGGLRGEPRARGHRTLLFNSLAFLAFLPTVFAVYWLVASPKGDGFVSPTRLHLQNLFVVAASYVFYGWWDWKFLLLITFTSLWAWASGLAIERFPAKGRLTVALALVVNLGILGVFKYFNFFLDNAVALLNALGFAAHPSSLKVILPVGISFYTFQALSYVLDVRRGTVRATRDLVAFLAYVSFFPLLVAGPIERATNLLPQFLKPRRFDCDAALQGVCLFCCGLFKKMVVADTLALYVDNVFAAPALYSSVSCLLGAVFFALQIYCDFSGYSDCARGLAMTLGFRPMRNFDRPYLATSFTEFWRRWHISLSTWFKDYVYIPLGGSRVPLAKVLQNTWIVFLLSGLWHGAAWTFVCWGAVHAALLSLGILRRRLFGQASSCASASGVAARPRAASIWAQRLVVFSGVCFAWIFFRAKTFGELFDYLKALFAFRLPHSMMQLCAGIGPVAFAFCLIAVGLFILSARLPHDGAPARLRGRVFASLAYISAIVFFACPSGGEFIYFQF